MSLLEIAPPRKRTGFIAMLSSLVLWFSLADSSIAADPQPLPSLANPQSLPQSADGNSNIQSFPFLPRPADALPEETLSVGTEKNVASNRADPPAVALNQSVVSSLTVTEMGQSAGLMLSNWQRQSGVTFTLPIDWVVTDGNLILDIEVSPALMESNTELHLMLNGQPLNTYRLNQLHEAKLTYRVPIPAAMIVSRNNLSFSIENGTNAPMECERGVANKYWVKVLPTSRLQLESQVLNIGQNMGYFPRPFFDPQAMQSSTVDVVFSQAKRPEDVVAAAIVSSYLGKVTRYNNLDFQVLQDALPEQNGIIFARPGEKIGELTLPQAEGPTLQIIDNPINPVFKLLLVMGRNSNEMRQAAHRLVSQPLPEKAATLAVKPVDIPVRLPYDAPRWIDTSKPVSFSNLVANADDLTVTGVFHDAVRVPFRAAPDLFMWDGRNVPLQIDYRFPTESWIDETKSQLSVTLNGAFLRSLPVNQRGLLELLWHQFGGDIRQESASIPLPPYLIYGDNMLELYFTIVPKDSAACNPTASDTIKSHIGPDSYIDLSQTYHFTELPNLSYFVGASFPFSKLADFSQTILLLAAKPTANEIRTLLNLAAQSGAATGSAISHVDIRFGLQGNESENAAFKGQDVLVVASLEQKDLYQRLLQGVPFIQKESGALAVKDQSALDKLRSYLAGNWRTQGIDADRYLSSVNEWRGFFSFRSVWDPQRVVVVASASSDDKLNKIYSDLRLSKVNAGIRGDLAVITDQNGVRSFQVGQQFPSGELPWYLIFIWYASKHFVLLSLTGLGISIVLGLSLYTLLRKHATKRLGRDAEDEN
ncbi:cellulose biosynthesis cyclic di-GMP-binding regulatory protein BcsB [Serratia sp. UGAL515B_01]|uniref:cellulose biosynthesis cyclic di-GMP-binding regulatory protein BcsB n=1 Tax=Serratia sp. UGAL515B_01 TaxID=2986763 RepID=UPI0029549FEA|nr:cellulose biosynthesis cyclic di-GMP-binding regulatory protein BcsB [Serratia sp. UGAL515B_01]WON78080.1 cellulose biosynthesis cyclic di-GMP-binding regulatory protein BcsB [Serratia sp. UGAL515B_01]